MRLLNQTGLRPHTCTCNYQEIVCNNVVFVCVCLWACELTGTRAQVCMIIFWLGTCVWTYACMQFFCTYMHVCIFVCIFLFTCVHVWHADKACRQRFRRAYLLRTQKFTSPSEHQGILRVSCVVAEKLARKRCYPFFGHQYLSALCACILNNSSFFLITTRFLQASNCPITSST